MSEIMWTIHWIVWAAVWVRVGEFCLSKGREPINDKELLPVFSLWGPLYYATAIPAGVSLMLALHNAGVLS